MASQQQFSGRTVADRYRLGSRRGGGVDAAVFDAFDTRTDTVVSLKVVHPDICANEGFVAAFDETMTKAAAIDEPHTARILDWGTDRWNQHESRYVTVEHLDGGSLRDVLDRGRTLTPSQTLSVGLDVLRALDAVHRGGLVHGDVRPSNIVFDSTGMPRLIDVGLGQLLGEVLWADAMHVSNDRAMYVAPEVAAEHHIVAKSDVYSLSLTMLECVTGKVPFVGDSTVATLQNRMNRLLPVSADLGPLAAVLERAGRPDPQGRSSVGEFGQALVRTAERLPRPAPISLLGAGLFDLDEAEATRQLGRPSAGAAAADNGSVDHLDAEATAEAVAEVPPTEPTPDEPTPDEPEATVSIAAMGALAAAAAASASTDALEDLEPGPGAPIETAMADTAAPGPFAAPTGAATSFGPPSGPVPVVEQDLDPTVAQAFDPDLDLPTQAVPVVVPPPPPTQVMPSVARVDDRTGGQPVPVLYDEPLPDTGGRRRRRWLWWLIPLVLVLAAAGAGAAWYFTRTVSHTVPDLTGKSQGAALNEVSGLGWDTLTPQEPSETVANGMVISTDPVAGTKLEEGKTLTILISTGPAPRTLPELKGVPLDQATATLSDLGLNIVQGDPVFDETIPSGSIVSWTVPDQPNLVAGNTVTKGATVRVIVSKGPAPKLPDVTGKTLDEATALLAAQQLAISQGPPAFDENVPQGVVVSWSVPGRPDLTTGATVDPGTTVQVVLSNGPAPRAVPSLGGLSANDAKAAVEGLQLVYAQGADEFSDSVPAGAVIRQDPAAGAQAPRGSTVTVVLSKGPDVVPMPEVTNLTLQKAQDTLAAAGLSVGTVTGTADGFVTSATVNGQPVATGQTLRRGTPVDLTLT